MWGRGLVAACSIGEAGDMSGSGWTKTGGEMLENVNGGSVSFPAVYWILLIMI